ncbi:MAG: DUF4238 domain-containing protein [Bacteroidota bacterium]
MTTEVKRQHYVPRTYLRNFATEQAGGEYYIHALPIDNPEKERIFELNITNVCLARHLYTLPGETAHERMLLETFYSTELEQHYQRLYQILIDPDKIEITPKERELIISTVVTMFYRTTLWINQHNEFAKRTLTLLYETCKQTNKDYFISEGEKISIAGKTLEEIITENKIESRPMQVLTQLETAFKLIQQRMQTDGIMVTKLLDDNCEFITSDNPVLVQSINGGRTTPFDPKNLIKVPLDKKHMLLLMPYAEKDTMHRIIRHNETGVVCNVKTLTSNSSQFTNSERFVLGAESSLNIYLDTKTSYERKPTEDELKSLSSFDELIQKAKDSGLI